MADPLCSFLTPAFALHDVRPTLAPLTFVFGAAQWSVRCLSLTGGACGSRCAPAKPLFLFDSLTGPSHLHDRSRAAFMKTKLSGYKRAVSKAAGRDGG